jgi:hypothetical protein
MLISVPSTALDHFWEELPEGNWEFWAFRWPVRAKKGDTIYFYQSKQLIATAVIAKIEKPGKSECERTGKYKNMWKVYWRPDSFVDLRKGIEFKACSADTAKF